MPRGDFQPYGSRRTKRPPNPRSKQYIPEKLKNRIWDYENGHKDHGGKDMTQHSQFRKPGSQK